MAKTVKERSAKSAEKRAKANEEELRLRVRSGTRQALADLMEWAGIEEQGEALTLMIHRLHELGPQKCLPLIEPPKHEISISPKSSAALSDFSKQRFIDSDNEQPRKYLGEALRICHDE